jgi:hypothetical protein
MSIFTGKTHVLPTLLLLGAAVVPFSPLGTLGAYGDTETSSANTLQAGEWDVLAVQKEAAFFSLILDEPAPEPVIESGEVAGTSTEPVVEVEVGEPVIEITTPEPEVVEETVTEEAEELAPTEPLVEVGEPVVEVNTPEPAPEPEPEPEPEPAPAAE